MMSDNISPPATARRSKLTKRRRYDDCTSTTTKATTITRTCSLQSLNNSSALVSTNSDSILQYSQQNQERQQQPASAVGVSSSSKNDVNVKNHNHERHWKENLQNDSSQPISSSSFKNLSSSIVAGRRTNDSKIGGGDELDYSTNSEKLTSSTVEQECSSSDGMTSNNINNQSSSYLGFMDHNMHHHSPYIMPGINWKNYYISSSSSKRLELYIEKAFTTFSNNNHNIDNDNGNRVVNQKNEESTKRVGQYRVDHPLVGRIDHHDVVVTDINHNPSLSSFAFPSVAQCNNNSSSTSSTSNNKRFYPETTTTNSITLLRRHSKTTGLGISIPYSWYRFPQSKRSSSSSSSSASSETVPLVKKNDNSCNVSDEIFDKQEVVNHCNDNQLVTNNTVIVHAIDKNLQSKTSSSSSSSLPSSMKQQQQQQPMGKIRIETGQKATIRELYDIDKSNIIIGTLHAGTERYYYEKRTLPPPPISLLDDNEDDDDEEEDECVAVVRYKVALLHMDIIDRTTTISTTTTSFISKDNDKNNSEMEYPLVGWISDRGRFADDPYLILREI